MDNTEYLIVSLTPAEEKRIFSKISIDEKTGCWNWLGALLSGRGYGVINFRGRTEYMHRIMYAWKIAPLPKGVGVGIPVIDHIICNNSSCCNPDHLKLGPQKRNVLRGKSPMAINARKVFCIRGHRLPEKPNEVWNERGKSRVGRRCHTCRRINVMNRYYRRKK